MKILSFDYKSIYISQIATALHTFLSVLVTFSTGPMRRDSSLILALREGRLVSPGQLTLLLRVRWTGHLLLKSVSSQLFIERTTRDQPNWTVSGINWRKKQVPVTFEISELLKVSETEYS